MSMNWTVEWRDSKTDQLIAPEALIRLKARPSLFVETTSVSNGLATWHVPGRSSYQDLEINYDSPDDSLGALLFFKWFQENPISEFADVSLRLYDKDQKIEEWYLEKCFVTSINWDSYMLNSDVTFKCGMAHFVSISLDHQKTRH